MIKRHFTRVTCSVGASIAYDDNVVICNTDNLSLRGMYLKTSQEIPLNIPVHVTVYHSNQSSFKARAKVVRREENGVGLQIDNLDVNSFVQLRSIVANSINDHGTVMQETLKMLKCIN